MDYKKFIKQLKEQLDKISKSTDKMIDDAFKSTDKPKGSDYDSLREHYIMPHLRGENMFLPWWLTNNSCGDLCLGFSSIFFKNDIDRAGKVEPFLIKNIESIDRDNNSSIKIHYIPDVEYPFAKFGYKRIYVNPIMPTFELDHFIKDINKVIQDLRCCRSRDHCCERS